MKVSIYPTTIYEECSVASRHGYSIRIVPEPTEHPEADEFTGQSIDFELGGYRTKEQAKDAMSALAGLLHPKLAKELRLSLETLYEVVCEVSEEEMDAYELALTKQHEADA